MEQQTEAENHVRIVGAYGERYDEILTPEVLSFLAELHERFEDRRNELLVDRRTRWERIAAGEDPDFSKKQRIFEKTGIGGSLRRHRAWRTGGLRSPDRRRGP
jgi:malate synthase